MPKITKKTAAPKVSRKVTEVVEVKTPVRKVNFFPIIAVLIALVLGYAYYRFGIVATVNGVPISKISYLNALEKQDKKQTIKQMANEALVLQEAAKKGVTIDQATIDTEIATVEAQIKSQGQTLDAALLAEGMTKADLEKQIRIQKIVEKLSNPSIDITQAQIDDYLKTNKASLPTTYTKDQLQSLAKEQLTSEAKNTAINTWFTELQKNSKIIIR